VRSRVRAKRLGTRKAGVPSFIIELEEIMANCRKVTLLDVNYGNIFPPNLLKLEADTSVITSSNYPNQYNWNEQCGFIIEAPEGSRLVHHICLVAWVSRWTRHKSDFCTF
jgi:hypothetical protein